MRKLLLAAFWIILLLLAASFAGAVHEFGDLIAVSRRFLALSLSAISLFLIGGYKRVAFFGIFSATLAMAPVLAGFMQPAPEIGAAYSLYQKNIYFKNETLGAVTADILQRSPDFVTLEEVNGSTKEVYDDLAGSYPSRLVCPWTVGGVAVLSKWPVVDGTMMCGERVNGYAAMQLATPAGKVWLISVHLHWPYPAGQQFQVKQILDDIGKLDGPILIGGDFNSVPWSYVLRLFERQTGSQRAGPIVKTFHLEGTPLRFSIDHILVPGGVGYLEVLPKLGSDHMGLLLRFDL